MPDVRPSSAVDPAAGSGVIDPPLAHANRGDKIDDLDRARQWREDRCWALLSELDAIARVERRAREIREEIRALESAEGDALLSLHRARPGAR